MANIAKEVPGANVRIRRARVQGFRSLSDLEVSFDDVSTIIGPNGVGKSSLLRALDWFFNGTAKSGPEMSDLTHDADEDRIRVEVEFGHLTEADRPALGSYAAPGSDRVLMWRTWTEDSDTFSGNARAYAPFGDIRKASSATDKRKLYNELRAGQAELALPAATNAQQVDEAMRAWEANNPAQLVDAEVESTTRFFGFMGDAKLAGLFDFVFVSADLRAVEETEDSKTALIGRLLERTVDRSAVMAQLDGLADGLNSKQSELVEEHLQKDLEGLATSLTEEISAFTSGRKVGITASPAAIRVSPLQFVTHIFDGPIETTVAGQGHGFQRALLLAALKLVAERGRQDQASGTVLLAIEEPELFQHPAQARSFARTLRNLAENSAQDVQVTYATHSPMFIEPGSFHQIRRFNRAPIDDGGYTTEVAEGSKQQVVDSLAGVMSAEKVSKQIDKVCPQQLSEAVFADVVILVEGETDRAILESVASQDPDFATRNAVVVDVSGKDSIPLCQAILASLNIPTIAVADSDSDKRQDDPNVATEHQAETHKRCIQANRRLLESMGLSAEDWPAEGLKDGVIAFFDPNLEEFLKREWPAWNEARSLLVAEEVGHLGKHAVTYAAAVKVAIGQPPNLLREIVAAAVQRLP